MVGLVGDQHDRRIDVPPAVLATSWSSAVMPARVSTTNRITSAESMPASIWLFDFLGEVVDVLDANAAGVDELEVRSPFSIRKETRSRVTPG